MDYKLHTLSSGLRVLTVPMPSLESATVMVWVRTGSRNESDKIAGLSHFLEHMVFKGSKKRPSAKAISEAVDAIGAEFNAATSKEWTSFYIKSRVDKIETAFDVLSDMVLNPLLKETEIEKEKGVILAEMAMYEDTPIAQIGEVFERSVFSGSTMGRDVIGLTAAIKNTRKNDFVSYRERYYDANQIVLVVSGGIKEKEVLKLAEKYFRNLESKSKYKSKKEEFENKQKKPKVLLVTKKVDQAHLILGFLGHPMGSKNRFIEAVANSVLGGGMSSRMFTEVREKRGLAYSVRVYAEKYTDCGEFATYAGVAPKNGEEAIRVMLDEYHKIQDLRFKIQDKELKKAKEYLKGLLALSLEDTKAVAYFFGERFLFGRKLYTPEEIFVEIDKIKAEQVYEYARETFKPEKLNLAIIGPYKSSDKFEKLLS